MSNANYSTLIATTLENRSDKIFDNVISNNALLYMLRKSGNIKVVSGGRLFLHPLLYKTNSSFAARGSTDTIALPITDPLTDSQWSVKVISGSVVLPALDVAMNAGSREKLLDYAMVKEMEAQTSMEEVLGDQLFNTSVGADDFDSIPRIIGTAPSADTDVGGINSSTSANSYWRNYAYTTAITSFSGSQTGINQIDTALNSSTFGKQGPTLIVTTKAIFTYYMLSLTSNVRYSNLEMGDAGFKALQYATIPFVFDDNVPANRLYGIDTNAVKLQVLAQGNFKRSPFRWKQDQLVESSLLYLFGNLTCGSRRTNFVLSSISGA